MTPDERVRSVCRTYRAQRTLGVPWEAGPLVTLVRDPARPDVWDANFGCDVKARTPAEIERVVDALDRRMAGVGVRKFFCDPLTPQPFVASLAVRGFAREGTVQLVLDGPLRARPRPVAIRRAEGDDDWASLAALTALDMGESLAKAGHGPPGEDFLHQFVGLRRAVSDEMQMWIAGGPDGEDAGFFASWPGVDGLGMVEWLFVRPEQRRRGVATALVAHAVDDARQRGADAVLIGASDGADAVPRRLYAELGFEPVCVTEEWSRFL
ncbi:MAG: GNAT family N-acetyltransferase [Myxococcota bacterium]